MPQNLDLQLLGRLSKLEDLQKYVSTANARYSRTLLSRSVASTPNLVELALTHARSPHRMAQWLNRDFARLRANIEIPALLALRANLAVQLDASKRFAKSRTAILATYLACTACPLTSDLASFAEIHPNTARRWLFQMKTEGFILMKAKSNELFCVNLPVLQLITSLSKETLESQFEAAVTKPDWIKRSIYSNKLVRFS